ncbi:MFS transporter [Zymobacter sp. IVIA_12111.31 C1]|uniref:MFS transporter n=1 Tax=Zymobacter sp. IVIA_12111.31 C1 TaxID=3394854 RepID=UPI0039C39AC7
MTLLSALDQQAASSAYRKIGWRLLPFLLLCYILAFLDRINIGFAQQHMQQDLHLSDVAYGIGAGIFFLGYVLFELPSNLLLTRIGMRKTVSRIMVLWGLTSVSMMFVSGERSFYALRVLLGIFEAGFAPAMFYYCAEWFPKRRLGGALAVLGLTGPIAGIIGAPLSSALIIHMDGVLSLAGWRWLFLVEGLPSVLVGIVAWFVIVDEPAKARWLTDAERKAVVGTLSEDQQDTAAHTRLGALLKDYRLYLLVVGYFCFIAGIYLPHYWLPKLIGQAGFSGMSVGWLAAIPSAFMLITIIPFARRSDRLSERRWHTALPMAVSALLLAFVTCAMAGFIELPFALFYAVLTAAIVSMYLAYVVFWSIPRELFVTGPMAAGGIALINSIGLCGGFISPIVVGYLRDATGSMTMPFLLFTATIAVGALAFALVRPSRDT